MSTDVSPLFRSFSVGELTLGNRIVMAPMTRNRSPHGVPGPDVAEYYARRARGGVGLLIGEATIVDHPASSGYPGVPAFFGEAALAGFRGVVRAVHEAGAKIFPQLWHVGAIRRPGIGPQPDLPGYSPSGIAKPGGKLVGHAMSESDIADVIAAFARGAAHARELGFDGVELHGAHGYLIDQFFWDGLNVRDDSYGGRSLVARSRFAIEVVRAVRRAVGPAFPVCFRFSQWKQQDYTVKLAHTPAELERFLVPLSEAGVDIFHCSTRRFFEAEFKDSRLNLSGWTKKLTGKPVITVGSVGLDRDFVRNEQAPFDLEELCTRLGAGEFDLVAVGRALISVAEWATKIRAGKLDQIRAFDKLHLDEPL